MNQGFAVARGSYVAFCNNDTVLPPCWAEQLLETARNHPRAAVVVPAITAARNPVNVRHSPGDAIEALPPFSAPPAAVVYVMPADIVMQLGGWGEEYEIASGEDVDLCFKAWVNDLDVVYDQRVLVQHVSKASASLLDDWKGVWARNRRRFLDKWTGDGGVPRIESCDPERFRRNRETARAVAEWMSRYFALRDHEERRIRRLIARDGPIQTGLLDWAHRGWRQLRPHLPARMASRLGALARRAEP
jgi:GT2 family glycosyltransferase